MRRADRLFQLIQILRGAGRPITASVLAEELEVSVRTVYRDIADLMGQRVPVRGEAGIGYVFEDGYDLPPLMLNADEIEAAVLGAQWVAARGDPALRRGARDLIGKLTAVMPEHLKSVALEAAVLAPQAHVQAEDSFDIGALRRAIREHRILQICYADEAGKLSQRRVWPIAIVYFDAVRLLAAWCELRQDFRHFRTDRVQKAEFLDELIPERFGILRSRWVALQEACGRQEMVQPKASQEKTEVKAEN